MDANDHDQIKRDNQSSQRYRSVMAPRQCEGISNALCSVFDPNGSSLPRDFERLLQQLN